MDAALPTWFETTSIVVMALILFADLAVVIRRPHVPTTREAAGWIGFYVALALVFGAVIMVVGNGADPAGTHGFELGTQFYAGWLTEYSLSVDNLFVFILIMNQFRAPKRMHQELLMVGIILALVLRVIFIVIGAAMLEHFSWLFYLFGAYLVWIGVQQFRDDADEQHGVDNPVIRWFSRIMRVHPEWHDSERWRKNVEGTKFFTAAVLVFLALGVVDLLFALDSIPAIFGITTSPFLVAATNVFALMGLRQLYFLLGGLMAKLEYLERGVAFILVFIGVKLVVDALHENELPFINGGHAVDAIPPIPTWVSLVVIVASLGVAVFASLAKSRRAK
jgi:tellurite resistance protein TerC